MKRRARLLRGANQQVLVHSGTGDADWPAGCEIHYTADTFEDALNDTEKHGAIVFVDEASVLYRDQATPKKHPTTFNLGQMGRHRGYTCTFATQYPTALAHNVRVNCSTTYCFRLGGLKYAKMVCEDNGLEWREWAGKIVSLPPLYFYIFKPMEPPSFELLT